jgi:hypothetical protein
MASHWRHFALSSVGITIGIGSLAMIQAFGWAIENSILAHASQQAERVEIVPLSKDLRLGMFRLGLGENLIADADVEEMQALPGVRSTFPKMRLNSPAMVSGGLSLLGSEFSVEIVAEGVPPELVVSDLAEGQVFEFNEGTSGQKCRSDRECGEGEYCAVTRWPQAGQCRAFVPVLASHDLLDLYNRYLSRVHRLPQLDEERLIGTVVDLQIGASVLQPRASRPVQRERARLVGFTDAAGSLALLMPLEVVQEANARSSKKRAGWNSVVLELEPGADVAAIEKLVEERGYELRDRHLRRIAGLVSAATLLFSLTSGVVLLIATVHVMHVFMLLALQRRKVIGIMRSLGATRLDVVALHTTESVLVGLIAGVVAVASAVGSAKLVELAVERWVDEIPLAPETIFVFTPGQMLFCVVLSVLCCVLGGILGVLGTARKDPIELIQA